MKAAVLHTSRQPLVIEARNPLKAPPGEAVVRLKAAALNRRDYFITQGLYPDIRTPVVLGSDGAGVVIKVGEGVDASWQGKEVVINPGMDWGSDKAAQGGEFQILGMPRDGTWAEEVAVPVAQLHAKPGHLSWAESAALGLAGVTAYRAVFTQGEWRAGQTVLITGIGGGVAAFALQFAVAAGASVWVTSSSPAKIDRAVDLGARGGFDYREEGWWKVCAKEAGPVSLIVDGAGGDGYQALLQLAAPGGCVVNYGATAGAPRNLDLFKVFWKQLRLQGSTMGSPEDFSAMLQLVERHRIKPMVHAQYALDQAGEALSQMERSPQFGKMVLTME